MSGDGDLQVTEVSYAAPADEPLLARVYRGPATAAGAPVVVDVHPGAWSMGDRTAGVTYDAELARRGFVVVAIDFRQAPAALHPAASDDVATALRWVRDSAGDLGVDPRRLGLVGSSSGGHLALLAACQAGPGDPAVRAVVALWPPVDPLARYDFALDRLAGDLSDEERQHYEGLRLATERYFGDRPTMASASIARLVAAGEASALPPLLVAQAERDGNVPAAIIEDLVAAWSDAGGSAQVDLYEGQPHGFGHLPGAATDRLIDAMDAFLTRHLA
jgi:acetyl esterase/lipase